MGERPITFLIAYVARYEQQRESLLFKSQSQSNLGNLPRSYLLCEAKACLVMSAVILEQAAEIVHSHEERSADLIRFKLSALICTHFGQ